MDPRSQTGLKAEILTRLADDQHLLEKLRNQVRPLRNSVRRIQPRTTTSLSLVGTDGGNNRLQFDPFLVQLIRVVDSSNNEYCLEAITPSTSVSALSQQQFSGPEGKPTALGEMMRFLGCDDLTQLSHMIRSNERDRPTSPSWVQVYRELVEWAVLFSIVQKDFGSDTLVVFDGLLRSKVFAGDLFRRLIHGLSDRIEQQRIRSRRRIYLVGMAKHSKVLARYRLAMALEGVLRTDYPAYVDVPRALEEEAYIWSEYARGDDRLEVDGEVNKFVGGKMFFAKFGRTPQDPIWPVDVLLNQTSDAQTVFGCLLADAMDGFPVPLYPQCLQRAHDNAALVDFDFDILQDHILHGLRQILDEDSMMIDLLRLQDSDPSQQRYG